MIGAFRGNAVVGFLIVHHSVFQGFIHQPKYCLPFMQPGRLVHVSVLNSLQVEQ